VSKLTALQDRLPGIVRVEIVLIRGSRFFFKRQNKTGGKEIALIMTRSTCRTTGDQLLPAAAEPKVRFVERERTHVRPATGQARTGQDRENRKTEKNRYINWHKKEESIDRTSPRPPAYKHLTSPRPISRNQHHRQYVPSLLVVSTNAQMPETFFSFHTRPGPPAGARRFNKCPTLFLIFIHGPPAEAQAQRQAMPRAG